MYTMYVVNDILSCMPVQILCQVDHWYKVISRVVMSIESMMGGSPWESRNSTPTIFTYVGIFFNFPHYLDIPITEWTTQVPTLYI